MHLRRSNDELKAHGESHEEEDTSWIDPVIAENEKLIAKQLAQADLVKQELSRRGTKSEHAEQDMDVDDEAGEKVNRDTQAVELSETAQMELDEPVNGVEL